MHDPLGHLLPAPLLLEHGDVRAAVTHGVLGEAHPRHQLPRDNHECEQSHIDEVRERVVFQENGHLTSCLDSLGLYVVGGRLRPAPVLLPVAYPQLSEGVQHHID